MTQAMQMKDTDTIQISANDLENLLEREWLLTNSRGSYVSGTVIGCNTRRYHGLLVASLHPPVERVVTLGNVLESFEIDGKVYELSNFEFSDKLHPQGYNYLKSFRRDIGVHFDYEVGKVKISKSIYLDHKQDVVLLNYRFEGIKEPGKFTMMPLVAMRDFHSLQTSSTSLMTKIEEDIVTINGLDQNGPTLHMYCPYSSFQQDVDWWYAMHYRVEARRGQHDYEDVWAPGKFTVEVDSDQDITFVISASKGLHRPGPMNIDFDEFVASQHEYYDGLIEKANAQGPEERALVLAADQFIVDRAIADSQKSASILAGFHWFADWGRDTFIALPGLLLNTKRYEQARDVLMTFSVALDKGQIPNRFDDYGGAPHYNSIDASLWFINAAWQYLQVTGDEETFYGQFRNVLAEIIKAYHDGTRDNIHADKDGLIIGGDANTQLTWMDAKCNGVAFTPRYGKAVEINALWYNGLCIMAETAKNKTEKAKYQKMANKVKASFMDMFWNENDKCLYDCVLPDGFKDAAIRPNQIFAVSLEFSPLEEQYRKLIVKVVQEQLLTPYGLRSLSPLDSRYHCWYGGDQFQRDGAYHQGTVWGWLIGPFIEAYLKINNFSDAARKEAQAMIHSLLDHMRFEGCLGNVSEIFDGDFPHKPKGCIAQAWSVAELLRSYHLINNWKCGLEV
ncbi:MAG: glycogen debranching enzyme family protein [Phycisphaerae bacterium]|nr:glycogen debranching enzyme family protein [Phycisphaerae bacterium]